MTTPQEMMKDESPRQPKVAIAAVLLNHESKILLSLRQSGKVQGMYSLPGGHLEWMETFVDGALRELREETGVYAEPQDCEVLGVDQGFSAPEDHCWVVTFVKVHLWEGDPYNAEEGKHGPWEWHYLHELPSNTLLPVKRLAQRLLEA